MLVYREALKQAPAGFSAATKCFCTEHQQHVADFAASVLGMEAVADDYFNRAIAYGPAYTIMGGTSDIMRNILGERVLGLPASPPVGDVVSDNPLDAYRFDPETIVHRTPEHATRDDIVVMSLDFNADPLERMAWMRANARSTGTTRPASGRSPVTRTSSASRPTTRPSARARVLAPRSHYRR